MSWNRLICVLALNVFLKIWIYLQIFKNQKISYFKKDTAVFLGKKEKDLDHRTFRPTCNIFPELKPRYSVHEAKLPVSVTHCCVSYTRSALLVFITSLALDWHSWPQLYTWVLAFSIWENQWQGRRSSEKSASRERGESKGFLINKNNMIAPHKFSQDLSQSKNTQRRRDDKEYLGRLKRVWGERERERMRKRETERLVH